MLRQAIDPQVLKQRKFFSFFKNFVSGLISKRQKVWNIFTKISRLLYTLVVLYMRIDGFDLNILFKHRFIFYYAFKILGIYRALASIISMAHRKIIFFNIFDIL